jgi:hydrogenase nickel incorporation protein HypA/HybF
MHELAISERIVAAITERLGDARVTRVVLEVGSLSGVVPDAVRFCFDVCAQGTTLDGAALDIVTLPARARCSSCAAESEIVDLVTDLLAVCPCGSICLEVMGGQELRIKEVEVG